MHLAGEAAVKYQLGLWSPEVLVGLKDLLPSSLGGSLPRARSYHRVFSKGLHTKWQLAFLED